MPAKRSAGRAVRRGRQPHCPGRTGRRSTCFYESVIASGEVEFVTAPEEKRTALDCIMHHCGGAGTYDYPEAMLERTAILRLSARSISGKSNIAEMKR